VNAKLSVLMLVLLSSFVALGTTLVSREKTQGSSEATGSSLPPVLVELFTSEGCSSCPPAEALLAKLDEQEEVAGAEVIALEEHVDYWDHQGWKDPFSSSQWTARQEEYAAVFHRNGVYTPQMIVDGWNESVGSREGQAREAILKAAQQPKVEVHLESHEETPSRYRLNIGVQMLPKGGLHDGEVWLAVTEKGLHTKVLRGENAGKDLRHSEVVRTLRKVGDVKREREPSYSGVQTVEIDPGWKRQNLRFVVFVQEKKTLRVLGAAAIPAL
jgi:hypothetical protein